MISTPEVVATKSFQFHKGTIRTRRWMRNKVPGRTFQFHKGTIRTERA